MRSNRAAIVLVAAVYALTGCATFVTREAELDEAPNGVRVYPPKVYLLVDHAKAKSHLIYAPDFARAYDVKPITVLSKQEFKIEIAEGQIRSLTSTQDASAFPAFVRSAADLGARVAGVGVSKQTLEGTFGLETGIYVLNDRGEFEKLP